MRDHKDDILIGDDQWIQFISLDGRYQLAIEVDEHLGDLWPLIENLETYCVAGCCGFDAFDFTSDAIHSTIQGMNCLQLLRACKQAQESIAAVDSSVVVSTRMNNLADKAVMLMLLQHIENSIKAFAGQQGVTADTASPLH